MMWRHPARWLGPYAEGALPTAQAREVARHVFECRRCRRALGQVRAGQAFAARLAAPVDAGPTWAELAPHLDERRSSGRAVPSLRWALAAAAALVVVGAAVLARGHAADRGLAGAAVAAHRSDAWQLRTGDAQVAAAWLGARGIAFTPPASNQRRTLIGATQLPGGAVALSYRVDDRPLTLVVGAAAGGSAAKEITRRSDGALEVSSWNRAGLGYALVASAGTRACTLCHGDGGPAAVL